MRTRWIIAVVLIAGCDDKKTPPPVPVAAAVAPAATATSAARMHRGGQHDNAEERPQEQIEEPLKVVVDGKEVDPWDEVALAKVKVLEENGKEAYSLRELVATLVGPKARLTTIVGQGGTRVPIDAKDWNDAAKTPLLRLNRQGQFKLQWTGDVPKDAKLPAELREVTKVEIATR